MTIKRLENVDAEGKFARLDPVGFRSLRVRAALA